MAEALTLIGGLAAIMQLAGSVVKLTRDLRVCVRAIRSAPKEIRYFILETSIFTDQLCYFHEVAKESAAVMSEHSKAKRAELVQKILRQCKSVKRGFARLVQRFIDINGADTALLNTFWARLLWLWKRPDVPELRLNLQSAIANVTLLCNLFMFEELRRKNVDSEKLEMLQQRLRNWVATARKLRCELAEYKKRKSPLGVPETAPEDSHDVIAEDSRQLERYVVHAIRSYTQGEALSTSTRSSRRGLSGQIIRGTQETTALSKPTVTGTRVDAYEDGVFREYIIPKRSPNEMVEERSPSRGQEEQPSIIVPSEQVSGRTDGDTVKDRDQGVFSEIGEWPAEVADPNTSLDATIENEAFNKVPQVTSQSHIEEELPRVSEQDSGPEEPELPKTSPTTELEASEASHDTGSEESRGPYISMAPFGGPRSRKRPRRPRPQSPIP
ncbi:hypothetical protein F5Y00DRAFT_273615 [Daldinia vernicosa]|uniref:uncharacterized protein n=1 Tax=Daldinia vernicosa TaxID=114800 RepID=UPI0020087665|nr:uncharacterized protein F5Y00DRAFT_273615 [Daldinia vernicosa]KAI0844690.1 hypothetical protein F5Y00DRAFT_273615 [Daldinia vernicosa]